MKILEMLAMLQKTSQEFLSIVTVSSFTRNTSSRFGVFNLIFRYITEKYFLITCRHSFYRTSQSNRQSIERTIEPSEYQGINTIVTTSDVPKTTPASDKDVARRRPPLRQQSRGCFRARRHGSVPPLTQRNKCLNSREVN